MWCWCLAERAGYRRSAPTYGKRYSLDRRARDDDYTNPPLLTLLSLQQNPKGVRHKQRIHQYEFARVFLFLSRVSVDIAVLSVCPLRAGRSIVWKRLNIFVIVSSRHGSRNQALSRNSDGVTPFGGAKYRWGLKISRFSTNNSLYLAN